MDKKTFNRLHGTVREINKARTSIADALVAIPHDAKLSGRDEYAIQDACLFLGCGQQYIEDGGLILEKLLLSQQKDEVPADTYIETSTLVIPKKSFLDSFKRFLGM